mmetsp:Transcript_30582/g.105689  ORF Transcript_30582/g.105689 Transcript_30582/m.105689 type:complete len:246 (+) Transcript_30582:597-1334(+)
MLRRVPAEKRLAPQHLREDAPHGPHVDGLVVRVRLAEQLGRAVPARDDVFCEFARIVVDASSEAKVADGQVAVAVHQQVRGLEVAVKHRGAVDELQTAEDLVEEVLVVLVRQRLPARDDSVQVALHEVGHDVDVGEVDGVRGDGDDVLDLNNVLVQAKVPEQLDLAQDALGVDEVAEHVGDLLDRHLFARGGVVGGAYDAVGPAADGLEVPVPDVDVKLVAAKRHRVVLPPKRHAARGPDGSATL